MTARTVPRRLCWLGWWRGAMARHGAHWRVVARGHLVHLHHAAHSTAHHTQHRCSTDGRQAPRCWCCRVSLVQLVHLVALPLGLSLAGASLSPRAGSCGDRRARSPGCSSTAVNTPFEIPIVCAALGDGLRGAARGDRIAPRPSVRGDGAAPPLAGRSSGPRPIKKGCQLSALSRIRARCSAEFNGIRSPFP